jgi:hypothetical protein
MVGGAPLERPVRVWWNFVAMDRARIAAAAQRWSDDGFPHIPGVTQRVAVLPWRVYAGPLLRRLQASVREPSTTVIAGKPR